MNKAFSQSLILMILFFMSIKSMAQEKQKEEPRVFYVSVEIAADYPGGIYKLHDFVKTNFKIPSKAVRKKVKGEIPVKLTVEKDGSLSDIQVLSNLGYGIEEEALRVFKLSPEWKPSEINGSRVKSVKTFLIYIDTGNKKDKRIYFEKENM